MNNKIKILDVNGLTLIYQRVNTNKMFAFYPYFNTGAITETDENSGITHFLEHMLAKETKTKDAKTMFGYLQKYFPLYNASTGNEKMKVNCYSSLKNIEIGFEFFSDFLINGVFNDERVNQEKKVIEQEIITYEADNETVAFENFFKKALNYPFTKNGILGDRNNVLKTTGKDLEKRYKELACKENMVFSFAGDVDLETVKNLLEKYFSKLPHNSKIEPPILEINGKEQVSIIKREAERCNIFLGFKLNNFSITNPRQQIMRTILVNYLERQGGPLWNKLREDKGLVYSYSISAQKANNVAFILYDFKTYKQNIKECITAFADVLKDIYNNGISKEDFNTIIDNFNMLYDSNIDEPRKIATSNATQYLKGGPILTSDEENEIYNSIDYNEFCEYIKSIIYSDFISLSAVGNVDYSDIFTIEELKNMFKN